MLKNKIKFHSFGRVEKVKNHKVELENIVTEDYIDKNNRTMMLRSLSLGIKDVDNDASRGFQELLDKSFNESRMFISAVMEDPHGNKYV